MKATGIVRRIDDLGRVVIPKEIRRTLRIREGDPLEIFTHRRAGNSGETVCGKPFPDFGMYGMCYGYRPGGVSVRQREKGSAGSIHQQRF